MSNHPWNYMDSNPTNASPQFLSNSAVQYYEEYPWTSTGTSDGNGTETGAGAGAETGGGSTVYQYFPTDSGFLPYSDFSYTYPTPMHYVDSYEPLPSSGFQALPGQGAFGAGAIAVAEEGPSGGAQTLASVKREEVPEPTSGFYQSGLEGSSSSSANGEDVPEYKHNEQSSSARFSELDLKELSPSQVVFYYGVLAAQALLLPRFEFTQGQVNQKWGGTLTMYGHTLVEPAIFKTQQDAKVELCQAALKKLVAQFPEWSVPEEPGDVPAQESSGRDWVKTLHDYCVQNGLSEPEYMEFKASNSHWRHKVQLEGGSFFGFLRTYPDVWESKNATAHMGLHSILVYGNGVSHGFSGPFSLQRSNESLLACVPRAISGVGEVAETTGRTAPGQSSKKKASKQNAPKSKASRRKGSKRKAGGETSGDAHRSPKGKKTPKKNANLLPVIGSKVSSINVEAPKEEKKWKITPRELQDQLKGLPCQSDRLEKACSLLCLQFPEIRVDRLDGRLVETHGEYAAAAYFQGDPFLTRAGAIGNFSGTKTSKDAAREACAGNVVTYLINIVKEDTAEEEIAASQRAEPYQWRESIKNIYEKNGWLG